MSLMLRLSSMTLAMSLALSANFNLESYVKKDLIKNPKIKVDGVELIEKRAIPDHKNWAAYMFLMDLEIQGKKDKFPETIFVNEKDGIVAMKLYDYKKHKWIGKNMRPNVDISYYRDDHLIAGKKDAKHKLVVFSDPMCPFCQKYVPEIYKTVKEHPDTFALYYYHMPLTRIHPVSAVLTRVMEVLQKKGRIDDAMKMYKLNIPLSETNEDKVLEAVKKQFNIEISKDEIDKKEIKDTLKADKEKANKVMLQGTPTVYLDGKFDPEVTGYKKLVK